MAITFCLLTGTTRSFERACFIYKYHNMLIYGLFGDFLIFTGIIKSMLGAFAYSWIPQEVLLMSFINLYIYSYIVFVQ